MAQVPEIDVLGAGEVVRSATGSRLASLARRELAAVVVDGAGGRGVVDDSERA